MTGKMNDWVGQKVTALLGSMWAAYLFAALAIYGFPHTHTPHDVVAWISQTFVQFVALSIIQHGVNKADSKHTQTLEHHRGLVERLERIEGHVTKPAPKPAPKPRAASGTARRPRQS
jgi:hypothetical protein